MSGSAQSMDALIMVMDSWYKQENDAYLKENLKLTMENKKLKAQLMLRERVNSTLSIRYTDVQREMQWRRFLLEEIFERFPAVDLAYHPVAEETEVDSDETEWVDSDMDF